MTLIGVEHLWGRVAADAAERAQRAHAADAEQHLLHQAMFTAASVEAIGDFAI